MSVDRITNNQVPATDSTRASVRARGEANYPMSRLDKTVLVQNGSATLPVDGMEGDTLTVVAGEVPVKVKGGNRLIGGASEVEIPSYSTAFFALSENNAWAVSIGPSTGANKALTQAEWYINATTGNDARKGNTPAAALKTVAEFVRRLGTYNTIAPAGGVMTVHLLTPIPDTDPLTSLLTLIPGNTVLQFVSDYENVLGTGSITAVKARWDAGDQNQPWEITASGPLSTSVGKRVVLTSGPNAGYSFTVVKDLGGGKARCSESVYVDSAANFNGVYFGAPAVGDTYKIVEGASLTVGLIDVKTAFLDTFISSWLQFRGLTLRSPSFFPAIAAPAGFVLFADCLLDNVFALVQGGAFSMLNCTFFGGGSGFVQEGASLSNIAAGAFVECPIVLEGGANLLVDGHAILQGGPAQTPAYGLIYIQSASLIYGGSVGCFDGLRSGVYIEPSSTYWNWPVPPSFGEAKLWGSGNAEFGVDVRGKGTLAHDDTIANLSVTGTLGDASIGAASVRPFDNAAGSYLASKVTSWANLAAAQPAGFGGEVVNPVNGAAFVLNDGSP